MAEITEIKVNLIKYVIKVEPLNVNEWVIFTTLFRQFISFKYRIFLQIYDL